MNNGVFMFDLNGKEVTTTAFISKAFSKHDDSIRKYFAKNKDKFIQGVDFYRFCGNDLKNVKKSISPMLVHMFSPVIILWSNSGVEKLIKLGKLK